MQYSGQLAKESEQTGRGLKILQDRTERFKGDR